MIVSDKKKNANRINSKRSTGPKSTIGKNASRRNAMKFGLSLDIATDPEFKDRINVLTNALIKGITDADRGWAIQAAAAELDLLRIRKLRAANSRELLAEIEGGTSNALRPSDEILERYERRAFARRRKALEFIAPNISGRHR